MTNITLTYFGFRGEGPIVKAARADASAKLQAYLDEEDGLLICRHPSIPTVFIMWREADGWGYRSAPDDPNPTAFCTRFTHCTSLGPIEEKEARRTVLRHLAGLTQNPTVARELLPNDSDWQAWRRTAAFQIAYLAAPESCLSDHQKHQWACEHDREFLSQVPA